MPGEFLDHLQAVDRLPTRVVQDVQPDESREDVSLCPGHRLKTSSTRRIRAFRKTVFDHRGSIVDTFPITDSSFLRSLSGEFRKSRLLRPQRRGRQTQQKQDEAKTFAHNTPTTYPDKADTASIG